MRISELSRRGNVPASTIRYYVKEGLLPRPVMSGKTVAYYTEEHVERLAFINEKQSEDRVPLAALKEMLTQRFSSAIPYEEDDTGSPDLREKIIRCAIELFFQKGYTDTSISDIVTHARISKETIYQHFRNKEEIFMECADRIFHEMYQDVWNDIRGEENMIVRMRKRAKAFIASYPKWIVMMNLVRSLSEGEKSAFTEKFEQVVRQIVNPIIHDLRRLHTQGHVRDDIDIVLAGYICMGMAEYGAALIYQEHASEADLLEYLDEILQHGLLAESLIHTDA